MRVTCSADDAVAVTEPDAVPWDPLWKATTVTAPACMTPLVVRVLLAHRGLALVESCTRTLHWSDAGVFSACSPICCGVAAGIGTGAPSGCAVGFGRRPRSRTWRSGRYAPEQGGGTTVRDRSDLARLGLAA